MGMPLELNTLIITKGRESRIGENMFTLVKEGYRLYPIDIPVEVRKTLESDTNGTAIIRKIELEGNQTLLHYELVSLNSIN